MRSECTLIVLYALFYVMIILLNASYKATVAMSILCLLLGYM